ncbi:MAG: 30S ribosomal protein S6 [Desulfovibrio sp.]|nr:MAG: 30S ribosomal protein S6 [Desulfovibrio sp.]
MRKYETLILLSPDLGEEEHKEILDNLTGIVDREQGKILLVDDWGMRDLAYPVNKQTRGRYVRLEYACPPQAVQELERNIRITEGIWKFVSVKLEEEVKEEEAA